SISCFFFSSRRRHTRFKCDWSSDVCSSDLFPFFFIPRVFHRKTSRQDRLAATIATRSTPGIPCFDPFLRRPVDVTAYFRFLLSVNLSPSSQAASVATLPSALLCERF